MKLSESPLLTGFDKSLHQRPHTDSGYTSMATTRTNEPWKLPCTVNYIDHQLPGPLPQIDMLHTEEVMS